MKYLDELSLYKYYFQFTLSGYGKDFERNVPDKKSVIIPRFKELSSKIGKEKVIWRYDPIIFTEKYTAEYHLSAFKQIAESLRDYTEKCVISFVDTYKKNKSFLLGANQEKDENYLTKFAVKLKQITDENGMVIATCSEKIDLKAIGIEHNSCIEQSIIERIIGCRIKTKKDKNQRIECGCVESVEIGSYNTCKNGCTYCYATYDDDSVIKNCQKYDPLSPILCEKICNGDKITDRKIKSIKDSQMSIEDLLEFS